MQGHEREKLTTICTEHEITFETKDNKIIFMCSEVPHKNVQRSLIAAVPKDHKFQIIIKPRQGTEDALRNLLQSINFYGLMTTKSRKLTIKNDKLNVPAEHPFWEALKVVLHSDKYFVGWDITLGSVNISYDKNISEKLQSRKGRDHCVTADEIKDLHITLNQSKEQDVDDFIKELFPE